MNQEEVFSVWAPQGSIWSRWVAPVLFAQTYWDTRIKSEPVTPQHLPWLQKQMSDIALVVDLPGADSVEVGFALAAVGFRPIPLYNASPGPEEIVGLGAGSPGVWNAVIDMGPIVDAISRMTASLQNMQFSQNAAPAFLLDSARLSGTRPADKGTFDNRWMVFPQDFPSASFLVGQGIRQCAPCAERSRPSRRMTSRTLCSVGKREESKCCQRNWMIICRHPKSLLNVPRNTKPLGTARWLNLACDVVVRVGLAPIYPRRRPRDSNMANPG